MADDTLPDVIHMNPYTMRELRLAFFDSPAVLVNNRFVGYARDSANVHPTGVEMSGKMLSCLGAGETVTIQRIPTPHNAAATVCITAGYGSEICESFVAF